MSPFVARQGGGLAQNLLLTSALPKSSTRLWLRSAGCARQTPASAPASPPKISWRHCRSRAFSRSSRPSVMVVLPPARARAARRARRGPRAVARSPNAPGRSMTVRLRRPAPRVLAVDRPIVEIQSDHAFRHFAGAAPDRATHRVSARIHRSVTAISVSVCCDRLNVG